MRHRLCALAVVVLLCASACSDPEPRFADPTSDPPTSEPVSTPTSDPPTSTSTPEPVALSPEETVRAWVDAFNTMLISGETGPFGDMSTKSCIACNELIASVNDQYAAGGSTETEGWTIASVKKTPDFATSRLVAAGIDSARGVSTDTSDSEPVVTPADKLIVRFLVTRSSGVWRVAALEFLS